MRRVTREDGATAVMVAIVMLVLFGFAALVLDVGALYWERRQLQNGADAAALAVAQDCAGGADESVCDSGPQGNRYTTAAYFAAGNANDGASVVEPDPSGVEVVYGESRVTVTATTLDAVTGQGAIRHWFAPILGVDATQVTASSTAVWGPVAFGSLDTIPLAFSKCEYDAYVPGPSDFASDPWTEERNGAVQVLYFHGQAEECHDSPSGQDLPGGFGWLANTGQCEASIGDGGWVGSDPGASPDRTACSPEWMEANVLNKIIALPVWDGDNDLSGNNAEFHVYTYVAFYVTGYNFGGQFKRNEPCGGNLRCIGGWFTTTYAGAGFVDLDGDDTGVRTVQLTE